MSDIQFALLPDSGTWAPTDTERRSTSHLPVLTSQVCHHSPTARESSPSPTTGTSTAAAPLPRDHNIQSDPDSRSTTNTVKCFTNLLKTPIAWLARTRLS